jgi:hypothetical protein
MVPRQKAAPPRLDVTAAMDERAENRTIRLNVVGQAPVPLEATFSDPFAEVEV